MNIFINSEKPIIHRSSASYVRFTRIFYVLLFVVVVSGFQFGTGEILDKLPF